MKSCVWVVVFFGLVRLFPVILWGYGCQGTALCKGPFKTHPFLVPVLWVAARGLKSGPASVPLHERGTARLQLSAEACCWWEVARICSECCWLFSNTPPGQGKALSILFRTWAVKCSPSPSDLSGRPSGYLTRKDKAFLHCYLFALDYSAAKWFCALLFQAVNRAEAQWKFSPRPEIEREAKLNLAEQCINT